MVIIVQLMIQLIIALIWMSKMIRLKSDRWIKRLGRYFEKTFLSSKKSKKVYSRLFCFGIDQKNMKISIKSFGYTG